MTNKITYQEAIETLQAMFSSLDEETLKSVLVMNSEYFHLITIIHFNSLKKRGFIGANN